MGIKGLTDQGASFPRIGELRKGAPKPTTGNKPGRDLDHFRFTSNDPEALASFKAAYGDEPASINVFLPFNTADENFEAWVEDWGAGSLKWRGDGERCVIWQRDDGTYSREPKPQPAGGKEVGRLKVIIPELRRLAYVVALTTSIHDIMEISANLQAYEALRGSLQGIPFVLSRVPRMVSTPVNGKRVRVEKWLLHLEAAPQWVQSQLSVMKRQALPDNGELLALESGDIVDVDTGEILEGDVVEFGDIPSASETPATNGTTPDGARTADEVKAALIVAAQDGSDDLASNGQLTYVRSSMSKLVEGDNDKAKLLLLHIYNLDSSTKLTKAQASALIDWIGATKDNDYTPSETAQAEAQRLLRAFEVERGQQELAI